MGSLTYASICTRPDISFATNKLSQFLENPSLTHWKAAKRILKYLKGTSDLGLTFQGSSSDMRLHVDLDCPSKKKKKKSISGYCVFFGNVVALWGSKKQNSVALSTTEAEYMALAYGIKEVLWASNIINESGLHINKPIPTLNDNRAVVFMATNSGSTKNAKHVDIKYHFVKDIMEQRDIILEHCSSRDMVVDILTKPLDTHKFEKCRDMLAMSSRNMLEHPPCGGGLKHLFLSWMMLTSQN